MKRAALFAAALLLSACGGGGSGGVTNAAPSGAQPSTTTVQFNLGDDPADRLLAASVTINSMSLISAGGGSVTVMSTPRPMEMMRLMGTVAPLAMAGVPQGTYSGVTMTMACLSRGLSWATGSVSKTSRAAPAIFRFFKTSTRAASSSNCGWRRLCR